MKVLDLERAVFVNVLGVNLLNAHNALAVLTVAVDKLLDAWRFTYDHAVAVHNRKRLVADKGFSLQNRVSQALHFLLSDKRNICKVGNLSDCFKELGFAAPFQKRFQLRAFVKVILDQILSAVCDD